MGEGVRVGAQRARAERDGRKARRGRLRLRLRLQRATPALAALGSRPEAQQRVLGELWSCFLRLHGLLQLAGTRHRRFLGRLLCRLLCRLRPLYRLRRRRPRLRPRLRLFSATRRQQLSLGEVLDGIARLCTCSALYTAPHVHVHVHVHVACCMCMCMCMCTCMCMRMRLRLVELLGMITR